MKQDQRIGSEVAGYRIESVIGRGGMGVVYLAHHLRLNRKAALKILAPELAEDERFRARFLRESELAASLDHPSIIPIYDAGEVDDLLYLAMRYVDGTDLKELIQSEGPLAPERTMSLIGQAADALDAAHARGLVHRDVKPANILIEGSAPRERVYLSDFGLTKRTTSDSGITATGQFVGTLDYAAPEQFEGKPLDARTDVYSLGCVLYECLTGAVPFTRDTEAGLVYAHLLAPPPKVTDQNPSLPSAIDPMVSRAMAKRPDDRPATCRELADGARTALGVGLGVTSPLGAERRPPMHRPRPALLIAGGALVAVAFAVVILLTRSRGGNGVQPTAAAVRPVDRVVRIDPSTGKIASTITVGSGPAAVAAGEGVWVVNLQDNTVSRIDPTTNRVTRAIRVGRHPSGIAVGGVPSGGADVWVANAGDNTVSKIDPGTNSVTGLDVPGGPDAIAVGEGMVWARTPGQPTKSGPAFSVTPIDPMSNDLLEPFAAEAFHGGMAAGEGGFWAGARLGLVLRYDPGHPSNVVATIELDHPFGGMAIGEGSVWVCTSDGELLRIDPATNTVVSTIPLGHQPSGVAVGGGAVWVMSGDGVVLEVLTITERVFRTIQVGRVPTGIAFGEGAVWVTVDAP